MIAIRFGIRRWRWTPRRFARWDIGSSIRSRTLLEAVPRGPVTRDESPSAVREALDLNGPAARNRARTPGPLLERTAQLLFDHSLFNGHPRFFGYITASPAPIGILGDFLAAAREPQRRRVDAVAGRHRDRVADRALDRRADRLSGRLRRPARQRRQHGELRLLHGRARREGRLERARAGRRRRRRRGGCASTPRPKRTRGFRRPPTSPASAPRRSAGSRPTPICAWTSPRCAGRSTRIVAAGDVPLPRRRHGRIGQHGRGRSAARRSRDLHGTRRLVPRGWRLRRLRGGAARGARRLAGAEPGRFGRGRSAQVALRAARGRLRAGARSGRAARRVRLSPALLPFRGARDELRRLRPAELARLPRAQGLAGAAAGRRRRLSHDDRRRHPPVAGDGRRRRPARRSCELDDAGAEHHDVPLRAARSAIAASASRRSSGISTRSTASCSIGCSAAARRSSRTPSSAAATCCAPAS